MSARRCLCRCHEGSIGDRQRADGVDIADPIARVTACRLCATHHEAAANEPHCPRPENGDANPWAPPSSWNGEDGG